MGCLGHVTNKIVPLIQEWQNRPLQGVYAVVFLDAIHFKVKPDGAIVNKAAYMVIGIDLDGNKDLLGMWIGEHESAKFWPSVLPLCLVQRSDPPEIRKLIYTTNIIESYHRQLRKVTKGKSIFPTDEALLKMLYLGTMDVVHKWTGRVQHWGLMLLQLSIFFPDRVGQHLR